VLKQLRRQLVIPFHPLRLVYPQVVALLPVMAVLEFQNLRFYNLHLILPFAWLFFLFFQSLDSRFLLRFDFFGVSYFVCCLFFVLPVLNVL
jgi:hypothetical protein